MPRVGQSRSPQPEIEASYEKSLQTLRGCSEPYGFLASSINRDNYRRVWSRDGVVQGLASLMANDEGLVQTFRQNLWTLKLYQDNTGRIPSNVDVESNRVSYGTLVGKVDTTLWFVIGTVQYYKRMKDRAFLNEFVSSLDRCMLYLDALELNDKGLLFVPTGGDWADEYITHGYVLFDELLYLQALRDYLYVCELVGRDVGELKEKVGHLKRLIEVNYLPSKAKEGKEEVYHRRLYRTAIRQFKKGYALPYFSNAGFAPYLDSFANSLLLILDVPSRAEKRKIIESMMTRLSRQRIKILPAFWPPITSDSSFWSALKFNSLFEFKNKPYHYHNGGLWPLIQGFFIAGLVAQAKKRMAREYLKEFADALRRDRYQFHEYFDSRYYKPRGTKKMGYSASGYIIGYLSAMKDKRVFA